MILSLVGSSALAMDFSTMSLIDIRNTINNNRLGLVTNKIFGVFDPEQRKWGAVKNANKDGYYTIHRFAQDPSSYPHKFIHILVRVFGSKVNSKSSKNTDENSPLHEAVINQNPEAVSPLLQLGADPNQKNKFGYTPLHYAFLSEKLNKEIIKDLLFYNANKNAQGPNGITPLQCLKSKHNIITFEKLLK